MHTVLHLFAKLSDRLLYFCGKGEKMRQRLSALCSKRQMPRRSAAIWREGCTARFQRSSGAQRTRWQLDTDLVLITSTGLPAPAWLWLLHAIPISSGSVTSS